MVRVEGQGGFMDELNSAGPWIGLGIPRKEDRRFLLGKGKFTANVARSGTCHAAFVRSPHAAATIGAIETSHARRAPGVVGVYAAADLDDPYLLAILERDEFVPTRMPLLAADRVRFAGEPVAVVLAESLALAEDAASLVYVEWEPLPSVLDIDSAQASNAPLLHIDTKSNCLADMLMYCDDGIDDIFANAAAVVQGVFKSARVAAAPLEGRACIAEWDDRDNQLIMHVSTQVPHQVRSAAAQALGMPETAIRVIAPDVGGGFGQKCVVGREELVIAAAALRARRPTSWIEDRHENLTALFHGHEQRYNVRAAFDASGRLAGLDADIECDVGAYSAYPFTAAIEPLMAASEMPGIYKVQAYRARARAVATNKAPTAPYRGVSRPQIVLVMERLIEKAARKLEIDVMQLRRQNMISPGEFPYTGVTSISYDEGSYLESLGTAEKWVVDHAWTTEVAALREDGALAGIGYSCFSERTGYGTPVMSQRRMMITPGFDTAIVRMDPTGHIQVTTGTSSHGQGHETTFAQIVADKFGVHPNQVSIRQGDTDLAPYGWGTFASRSIVIGGGAVARAAEVVARRLQKIAAYLLGVDASNIELSHGVARSVCQKAAMPLSEIARIAHFQSHLLPPELRYGLVGEASFDPPGTFSNACHAAFVVIDQDTGEVRVHRYLVVEDCGVMINPRIVDGQIVGGVAQGLGAALYESIQYSTDGQPLTGSLMDYLVPTASEMCQVDIVHLETPSRFSESGAKGMGEGGMIGAPSAILNAINNALGKGARELDHIPVSPEDVIEALTEGSSCS